MGIGNVIGGALQGIGAGMMAQTQANAAAAADAAKETAAMRRELALEALRNQNATTRDKAQSDNRINEMMVGATLDDWKGARANSRKTASQITVDQAKAKIDADLKRLESKLKVGEDTKAWLRDIYTKAYMANTEVGETKEGADGSIIVLSKAGKVIAQTKPGMIIPKNDAGAGLDGFPGAQMPGAPAGQKPAKPTVSNW